MALSVSSPESLRDIGYALLLIFVLGFIVIMIRPGDEGFTGATRCGVDQAPCAGGQKCINGFCAKTEPARLYERRPVPILPDGVGAPYF